MRKRNNRLVYWLYAVINSLGGSIFTIKRHHLHNITQTFKYDLDVYGPEGGLKLLRAKLVSQLTRKGFVCDCVNGAYIKEEETHYELVMFGNIGVDVYGNPSSSKLVIQTETFSKETFKDEPRPQHSGDCNQTKLLELC